MSILLVMVCAAYAAIWHWYDYESLCNLYNTFHLRLFFSIVFYNFNLVLKRRSGQWYQHLLTLFAIFYESNTEGSNFRIRFIDV